MSIAVWISVGAGGAIGAMARLGLTKAMLALLGSNFPWGTLTVNITGSILMGVAISWLSQKDMSNTPLAMFLTVGVLGAFTTFSTFAADAIFLYKERSMTIAFAYMSASVMLSLGGLMVGFLMARSWS
ncbi:MAG: fluoride efflux transporter CrcB [Pseudomonadota bacterium]